MSTSIAEQTKMDREEIEHRVRDLGQWFHNLNIAGVQTAPDHFLGDYPSVKWQRFQQALPTELRGKSVLDIGCNAGFYSIEMKRRGADRVVGIDFDDRYLAQAKFAADALNLEIEFRKLSVYDVHELGEKFDLVLFLGVFYHLRHPLLALDLIHQHVARDFFLFQSMQRGSEKIDSLQDDYDFWQTEIFERAGFPKMYFVEKRYAGDPTNWWIPNRACVEAMLRSAGFKIIDHPEAEVFACKYVPLPKGPRAIYSAIRRDDYE
jgi:tRNA (mo5U34)-methyltransferase